MATRVTDLAAPILLYLAALRRSVGRLGTGEAAAGSGSLTGDCGPVPDAVRDELITLFEQQDERAAASAELSAAWVLAKPALIHLLDEVLSRPSEWPHHEWWRRRQLHDELLRGMAALGAGMPPDPAAAGDAFFAGLAARQRDLERAMSGAPHAADVLAIYLICLQFGYEGQYAGKPYEIQREMHQILAKLPAGTRTQARELFPDAYRSTLEVPPNYEPLMKIGVAAAVLVACVVTFFVVRAQLWNGLAQQMHSAAQGAGTAFRLEAAPP